MTGNLLYSTSSHLHLSNRCFTNGILRFIYLFILLEKTTKTLARSAQTFNLCLDCPICNKHYFIKNDLFINLIMWEMEGEHYHRQQQQQRNLG
uniref:Uncharacterized protein n=1 Tax=Octopus bimaculoides TaxID=37653 RepID=A0A0L8HPI9_OCTBM